MYDTQILFILPYRLAGTHRERILCRILDRLWGAINIWAVWWLASSCIHHMDLLGCCCAVVVAAVVAGILCLLAHLITGLFDDSTAPHINTTRVDLLMQSRMTAARSTDTRANAERDFP